MKDGRVVKGVRFVDLRDAGDPVEAALAYDAQGADELVFLDITASHEDRATILDVVRRTAEGIFMPLTVGGGVRSLDDIRTLLRAGADKVSLNTAALARPELDPGGRARASAASASSSRIDAKRRDGRPGGAAGGSTRMAAAGRPGATPSTWAREVEALGAGEILLTSMDRDGTGDGYDLALTRAVAEAVSRARSSPRAAPARSSTSARASTEGGADAALAASIFHFGRHTIAEAKGYLARARRARCGSSREPTDDLRWDARRAHPRRRAGDARPARC